MRWLVMLLGLMVLAGCATSRPGPRELQREYEEAAARSLVFNPPVTYGLPPIDLQRDLRQPAAVLSYNTLTTTYFYILVDDWQFMDTANDCAVRRSVSETFGVSYR